MNIWIITTGSSDVQLKSDEYWHDWYERSPVKRDCYKLPFKPIQIIEDSDEPYRIAPRVLSMVYEAQPEEVWECLEFPLLRQFTTQLQGKAIDKIFILLTEQADRFNEEKREDRRCPYWQDTFLLKSILERYFQEQEEFRDLDLIPIPLSAEKNKPGLDDWNHVLTIVQTAFSEIKLEPDTVYVSHQAGTPAISSAVQFVSLARFGKQVQFLVSNEYDKEPLEPIKSSEYLKGIKFQEAKALLERHDYSGVKELLASYLKPEIETLLNAAIQWNFAKFEDFAKVMTEAVEKYSKDNEWWLTVDEEVKLRSKEWWWTAYESAYLGIVRLKQGNTVEAMFHSFRAVEGLLAKWVDKFNNFEKQGKKFTKQDKKIKLSHEIVVPWGKTFTVSAYGQGLYLTLEFFEGVDKNKDTDIDIWTFGKFVFATRNELFHKLEGLQDKESVFKAWEISTGDEQEWKDRVLGCLNFVSGERFKFLDREELDKTVASLMVRVHEKLVKAISQDEHTP